MYIKTIEINAASAGNVVNIPADAPSGIYEARVGIPIMISKAGTYIVESAYFPESNPLLTAPYSAWYLPNQVPDKWVREALYNNVSYRLDLNAGESTSYDAGFNFYIPHVSGADTPAINTFAGFEELLTNSGNNICVILRKISD